MAEENRLPLEESRGGGSRPKRVYRPKKERIALIRQDAEEGVPSIDLIAGVEGLRRSRVYELAREAGIVLPKKWYKRDISQTQKIANIRQAITRGEYRSRGERIALIRQAAEEGVPSVELIAQIEGLKLSTVRGLAREAGIVLPKKWYKGNISPTQKIANIRLAITQGEKSLERLCQIADLAPSGFYHFHRTYSIELPPDLIPYRYRPEMDAVIDRIGTLEEIGRAGGYKGKAARESGNHYVRFSGQHKKWLHDRKEAKQYKKANEQKTYQELASDLEARINQLVQTASWPEYMALRYIQLSTKKYVNYSHKKLVRLFERYEIAKGRGRKLSLEELGRPLGITHDSVRHIFRKVGLKPMYRSFEKHFYTRKEKEKAWKIYRLGISFRDTEFFAGIPDYVLRNYTRKRGFKFRPKPHIKRFGALHALNYRLASQIYEAQYAGIRQVRDIAELLDTTPEIVRYAIERNHHIAPIIVQALRIAYANPQYNKPYKITA